MKTLSILIGLTLIPTFAGASALDGLSASLAKRLPAPATAAVRDNTCVDFSGNWKGQCVVAGGETTEDATVIQQTGCESLTVDSEEFPIGGLTTISHSGSGVNLTLAMHAGWNETQTELKSVFQGLAVAAAGGEVHELSGHGVTKLENGRLRFDLQVYGASVTCLYDRQ